MPANDLPDLVTNRPVGEKAGGQLAMMDPLVHPAEAVLLHLEGVMGQGDQSQLLPLRRRKLLGIQIGQNLLDMIEHCPFGMSWPRLSPGQSTQENRRVDQGGFQVVFRR